MSTLHVDIPAPRDALVRQRFWSGTAPIESDRFRIDAREFSRGGRVDLSDDGALAHSMRTAFDAVGLVHVTNTGLTAAADMRALVSIVMSDQMDYEGGSNPRDRLDGNVYEIGAPLSARLPYHHEMAYVGASTTSIGFVCLAAIADAARRGATFVASGVHTTDAILATALGRKLADLGVCYHRDLTDADHFADRIGWGVYNHWQKSFGTDDPEVAESKARDRDLVVEWGPNRLMRTRYYAHAFEYHPGLDRNLLYASLADHGTWFDTWPMVQHLPHAERPLRMTFGDDSEFTAEELQTFIDVYDRFGMPIDWGVGDVAVLCNYRWAHGRPGIDLGDGEQRELGVVLGSTFDRVGPLPTKW